MAAFYFENNRIDRFIRYDITIAAITIGIAVTIAYIIFTDLKKNIVKYKITMKL